MSTKLPRVSKKAYDLRGEKAHVLLLHGYTGSPYDLRPLADYLHSQGFHVVAPLLKGHGTKPSDLYDVSAEDWLLQSQTALQGLDNGQPIIVGGLSMGALLSILLAKQNHHIAGLLLFSPAMKLGLSAELVVISAKLSLLNKTSSLKKLSGGSDILDPVAKKKCPSYQELPISGLLEFEKLRALAIAALPEILCPIFAAFGQQDSSIDISQSHRMILEKTRKPLICKFYKNSKHVITLDYDKEQLFLDVLEFLTNCL